MSGQKDAKLGTSSHKMDANWTGFVAVSDVKTVSLGVVDALIIC